MLKKGFIIFVGVLACTFSSFAQDKFGYLNYGEIIQVMPEYIDAQKQVDTKTTEHETKLNTLRDELNKKFAAYQQERNTLTEELRDMREEEINNLNQRIQNYVEVARQEIQKLQAQLLQPIQEKFTKAINAVGNENGFTSIIDSNSVLYFSPTKMVDVSSLLKAKLGIK